MSTWISGLARWVIKMGRSIIISIGLLGEGAVLKGLKD
jgi:hypothetical protein